MSHTTKLKSLILKDATAIRQAVQDLNAEGVKCHLAEDARPRMYFGNQSDNCEFVLVLEDSRYDVGFEKQDDGSYIPVFDEWQGYVNNTLGAGEACPVPNSPEGRVQHQIGKFAQHYTKHATINAAAAQGYFVEGTTIDEQGNIHLTLGGM